MPSVILKTGKDRRLRAGHCWAYAGEVAKITGNPKNGDAVDIRDHKERYLGCGLLNSRSQIIVRRFSTRKVELDERFLTGRIESAWLYRQGMGIAQRESFRVVSSEADLLPGLIVDKYGDHIVLQTLTLGMDQRKSSIVEILRHLLNPQVLIERNDVPVRKLEGLEEIKGVLSGESKGVVQFRSGCFAVEAHLLDDQKTGFFLDQHDNYAAIGSLSRGKRVLDCFSYHGGFALNAALGGAASVEAIEISQQAIDRARHNAKINQLEGKIEFKCANAFDVLKNYDAEKREFDLIVLDPPSFTRARQNVDDAVRGYKEINLRALKMLAAGGLLATFSCSHHIGGELLKAIVLDAAADARKTLRLVKVLTQCSDHPILPSIPETEYLKGFVVQVVSD